MLKINDKRFSDVEKRISKMNSRAKIFAQGRSNYQLEKFVLGSEYTLITKYKLIAHNSFVAMQEIRRMIIERERILREINFKQYEFDRFKLGKPHVLYKKDDIVNNYDLDIYEKNRQLEDIELRISGLSKEVDYMEQLCDKLEEENGKPFTMEQYNNEEPIYWEKRVANQMHESQKGKQLGIDEGNYRLYLQSLQKPLLNDNMKIKPFPLTMESIAVNALQGREGIEDIFLKKIKEN